MTNLKECIKGCVHLVYVDVDHILYRCDNGFTFPIFKEDWSARFPRDDKAILYMRWIRKHIAALELQGC